VISFIEMLSLVSRIGEQSGVKILYGVCRTLNFSLHFT